MNSSCRYAIIEIETKKICRIENDCCGIINVSSSGDGMEYWTSDKKELIAILKNKSVYSKFNGSDIFFKVMGNIDFENKKMVYNTYEIVRAIIEY